MNYPTEDQKKALYNRYANDYQERTSDYTSFLTDEYRRFQVALLGDRVLDLGCGPGRDAAIFQQRGLNVICLDLSEEMLAICQDKGLKTVQQNMEQLELPEDGLDGVWSYTSLTTIPKEKVWEILNSKLPASLTTGGVLFLGLIEGEGEYWKEPDAKYDLPRFISRWQKDEVLQGLDECWELEHYGTVPKEVSGRNTYLHFLLRRR